MVANGSAWGVRLSAEVEAALAAGAPVVALESTVIAHGLPVPQNLEVAREMEQTIRREGAVPATVALLDGRIVLGLNDDELRRLAEEPGVAKASRRDLAALLTRGCTAATTVAGTLACAALGGIRVFATGGIGGVHRGAERSMDVSADLPEIARAPLITVCAGAKAVLDLPRTLEYLETLGVPVLGMRTDELPAFYSRRSGLNVPHRVETAAEVAAIARAQWQSGLGGGVLLTCPIPLEAEIPAEHIAAAIGAALDEAEAAGVRGAALTPYLLAHLARATDGRSVEANRALLLHNAAWAARVAVALVETATPA